MSLPNYSTHAHTQLSMASHHENLSFRFPPKPLPGTKAGPRLPEVFEQT